VAHSKTTGAKVATKASGVLRGNYSKAAKSVAGSALSQRHKSGGSKKR
jgi:hypothetical protein